MSTEGGCAARQACCRGRIENCRHVSTQGGIHRSLIRLDRLEARGGLTECRHFPPPTPKQLAGMTTGWAVDRVGYNIKKLFTIFSAWFVIYTQF